MGRAPNDPSRPTRGAPSWPSPARPSAELTDLLDGTVVPLAAIFGLDDQRFRAFALEVARLTRLTDAGRLVVGAYLHRRRDQAKRGSGPVRRRACRRDGRKDRHSRPVSPGRRAALRDGAGRAAKSTRRRPLPGRRPAPLLALIANSAPTATRTGLSSAPAVSPPDASNDHGPEAALAGCPRFGVGPDDECSMDCPRGLPGRRGGRDAGRDRPAFPELADWLDGSRIPIDVAYGLDNERLAAIVAELGLQIRVTERSASPSALRSTSAETTTPVLDDQGGCTWVAEP